MNSIMRKGFVAGMSAVALLMLNTGCAMFESEEHEQVISMNELPAAVKAAAEKEIAGCKVKEVEKEVKDGKVIYSISYYEAGGKAELEYAEDGKLISKEKK